MKKLLALFLLIATPVNAFECHTALVLALDASRCVDQHEHELQRTGLADALRDPEFMAALAPAPSYDASAMTFEWSNPGTETVLAPWAVLDGPDTINRFAAQLLSGPGNAAATPAHYRTMGLFDGLVINGLVIRHPFLDSAQPPLKDPLPYYQTHVIQGPGAFVEVIRTYDDYPAAIRRKLLRELSPSLAILK